MPLSRPRVRSAEPASRNSVTAAAERLADRILTHPQVGESWQEDAWALYDAVPELRTAARITGQAMSQCRLVIARVSDEGDPSPLDPDEEHPARDLLDSWAGGHGGQAELLDALGVYLTVTGESIVVGALDPAMARFDPFLRAQAYSPEQVVLRNRQITVRLDETSQADRPVVEADGNTAIRVWRPHPRFRWQADSAARSALEVLREITLYDAHIKATALSRLAGAGLLMISEGMTLPTRPAKDDGSDPDLDPFMLFLMDVMGTAIKDRDSAAAHVPILVRGEPDDIAAARLLEFATEFDNRILELRNAAIDRLGVAVDMPPEILKGIGDTQHWTGSLVTDQWVQTYLAGLMTIVCASLTTGWLYPALTDQAKKSGLPTPPADVIIWYDASSLRTRPNIGPEAQALYDRMVIGPNALRRSSGYDEGDAPTPTELEWMLKISAFKADADTYPPSYVMGDTESTPRQGKAPPTPSPTNPVPAPAPVTAPEPGSQPEPAISPAPSGA